MITTWGEDSCISQWHTLHLMIHQLRNMRHTTVPPPPPHEIFIVHIENWPAKLSTSSLCIVPIKWWLLIAHATAAFLPSVHVMEDSSIW